jgi:hypothetical protein
MSSIVAGEAGRVGWNRVVKTESNRREGELIGGGVEVGGYTIQTTEGQVKAIDIGVRDIATSSMLKVRETEHTERS